MTKDEIRDGVRAVFEKHFRHNSGYENANWKEFYQIYYNETEPAIMRAINKYLKEVGK